MDMNEPWRLNAYTTRWATRPPNREAAWEGAIEYLRVEGEPEGFVLVDVRLERSVSLPRKPRQWRRIGDYWVGVWEARPQG